MYSISTVSYSVHVPVFFFISRTYDSVCWHSTATTTGDDDGGDDFDVESVCMQLHTHPYREFYIHEIIPASTECA